MFARPMDKPALPPFASLLKSREVEDPVNIWVHRPLAYAFVKLIFRTPMTPNMVTFLAILVGVGAGVCFLVGTQTAMVWGGAMLWTSAILDGADGILARAKNMQSEFGRAIDGVADMIVAIATVFSAFAHILSNEKDLRLLFFMVPAVLFTVPHVILYDFYKESYLRMTRVDRGGEGEDPAKVAARMASIEATGEKVSLLGRIAMAVGLLPMLNAQNNYVKWSNPDALGEARSRRPTHASAEIYRRENRAAMKLWTVVSLCPHSYLMAICAMADRLDIYLWIRLVFMNLVFIIALFVQRRSTRATLRAWAAEAPVATNAVPA